MADEEPGVSFVSQDSGMGEQTKAWDVYREIHKAMRFAVAGVTTQAGQRRRR